MILAVLSGKTTSVVYVKFRIASKALFVVSKQNVRFAMFEFGKARKVNEDAVDSLCLGACLRSTVLLPDT